MHRVPMTGQGADFQLILLEKSLEFLQFPIVVQVNVGPQMVVIGIAAGSQLHGLDAEAV